MIRKNLHNILSLCPLLMLTACADNDLDLKLTDEEKTPLTVIALLDVSSQSMKTRAQDMKFETDDKLLAYIRHVKWDRTNADTRESVNADKAPVLVTFTKGSDAMAAYSGEDIAPIGLADKEMEEDRSLHLSTTNTQQTSDLTNDLSGGKIYWDDFSDASSAETDLHTDGHYLQSFYGYCYNGSPAFGEAGSSITSELVEDTGELGWQVAKDQTSGFQTSDLLWSAEQTPVKYDPATSREDTNRAGIVLPYTHAMSKVTINVIAGDGFASPYYFSGTGVTLDKFRISCKAIAPTATLDCKDSEKGDIDMYPGTIGTTESIRPFQAIVVPSVLTVGNKLAQIKAMDGNNYDIYVTDNIINGWSVQLTDTDEDIHNGTAQARPLTRADKDKIPGGKGHQMKSGVNYVLNVTVNKTEVNVTATILDWTEVTAEGKGVIYFEHDVKDVTTADKDSIAEALQTNGFDVYTKAEGETDFGTKATSLRWNRTSQKWKYNPTIYWMGGNQYFRALSNVKPDASGTSDNESLIMENGRDALWGTTAEHAGKYDDNTPYNYAEGDALPPRTGHVPLVFYHAMSKITINLEDYIYSIYGADYKEKADPESLLDLEGATIQLTNLYSGGTIELDEGKITPTNKVEKTFSEDQGAIPSRMGFFAANENGSPTNYNSNVTVRDYFITPQSFMDKSGEDPALLIVTLANGTTYKTKLNLCNLTGGAIPVQEWEPGKHYIYTITLAKDQIMFRAEIKEWDEVKVSGIITPEW